MSILFFNYHSQQATNKTDDFPFVFITLELSEIVFTERNGNCMRYRIEYADGRCCSFANSRNDLIEWLKLLKDETVSDIRKVYKNGVTDSVKETYAKYIK